VVGVRVELVPLMSREARESSGGILREGMKNNVLYKRAGHISERATPYHLATTILYCYTTTLGTNYDYI
jgi:hypothetical protein